MVTSFVATTFGSWELPTYHRVVFVPFVSSVFIFTEGSSLALLGVNELIQEYSGHLKSPDET